MQYKRFAVKDNSAPTPDIVDEFVEFIKINLMIFIFTFIVLLVKEELLHLWLCTKL